MRCKHNGVHSKYIGAQKQHRNKNVCTQVSITERDRDHTVRLTLYATQLDCPTHSGRVRAVDVCPVCLVCCFMISSCLFLALSASLAAGANWAIVRISALS